jgi:hypothetical protein
MSYSEQTYEDYVYSYDDLFKAYEKSGTPDYEQYVYDYPDLLNAYNNSGTRNFAAYVNSYPDLLKAYRDSGTRKSKEEWGQAHWDRFGSKEGRTVPREQTQSVEEWGKKHWESNGSREKRNLPTYQTQSVGEWGRDHWLNNGRNEARVLPGEKISIDKNGILYVSDLGKIGSGLKRNYEDIVQVFRDSKGGNYKGLMEGLKRALTPEAYSDLVNTADIDTISAYYKSQKVKPWDAATGAQPPTGGFDASYYRNFTDGGVAAENQWNQAEQGVDLGNGYYVEDLDITGRYTFDSYMHWHYTTQGKAAGYRGNEEMYADLADAYEEYLTDAEYEMYRDKVLGGGEETILGKEIGTELAAKEKLEKQRFGSLTTDSLKKAADELLKAKAKERDLEFYKGLEGFNEVLTINETIANSLLGDSGIGGILGFVANPYKAQESLEKSLAGITGVPSLNGVTYNWQKWFDEQLAGNYEKGITVQDPLDPNKTYTLTGDFAKRYIDEYLTPRFDSSKSMSEFITTLEVTQQDQDVLNVQTALAKLRDIGEIRAQAYLDNVYATDPLNFNVDFYMNPTGNFAADDPKLEKYTKQKEAVAKDWETARKNGSAIVEGTSWTWDQWAYYYGLNVNDKSQFAQLHYQVRGVSQGFDPAKDVLTLKDATDYISTKIIPEIAAKDIDLADVNFLQFVTPEEFADSVIEGISPETNKEEWDKMLSTLGIAGSGMGIDEVKQYISDQFRTGNAVNIRQSIKYLNEKGKAPSQKELGVDYIQRAEDAAPSTSPYATTLYKIFKNAGYQGSEDDFYGSFMTDVDKGEMQLLEQGASEKGLQIGGAYAELTSDDPFESLKSITGLFGDTSTTSTASADSTKTGSISSKSSYFKLLDDEEEPTKSKSAEKILGEFTSLFKGFA